MPGISGVVYRCGEVKLWTENGAERWELAGVCGIHSARCARRPWYRRDRMHDDGTADCRDAEADAYSEHGRGCERGDSYKGWAVIVSCRRRVGRRGTASTSGTRSSCGLSNTSATGTPRSGSPDHYAASRDSLQPSTPRRHVRFTAVRVSALYLCSPDLKMQIHFPFWRLFRVIMPSRAPLFLHPHSSSSTCPADLHSCIFNHILSPMSSSRHYYKSSDSSRDALPPIRDVLGGMLAPSCQPSHSDCHHR